MGYRLAVLRQGEPIGAEIEIPTVCYLGWAASVNRMVSEVLKLDPSARWCVVGNDDTLPDPNHSPEEIGAQCEAHFGGEHPTFGVMQPTGDKILWPGSLIENFAGSPWFGREYCERINGGRGPLWDEYFHNWADEECQQVALQQGIFWQRHDLIHQHNHWARERGNWADAPDFVKYINGQEYKDSEPLFRARKSAGFPGSDPLPLVRS